MSILKSVLLGAEGSYNILGIPVTFGKYSITTNAQDDGSLTTRLAKKLLDNNIVRLGNQAYAHLFAHEMSHAMMTKLLLNRTPNVYCNTDDCTGSTISVSDSFSNDWKNTLIEVAGPMGDVAFATCKLVATKALENYIPWPVTLVLMNGAFMCMANEIICAYESATKRDHGDFGQIARRSRVHLVLASTALITQCAVGILVTAMVPSF